MLSGLVHDPFYSIASIQPVLNDQSTSPSPTVAFFKRRREPINPTVSFPSQTAVF